MTDIADWLAKPGMSAYAQSFAENDIDFSLLSDLSDQNLKELGVSSLGHRRKILRAIAQLGRPRAAPAFAKPQQSSVLREGVKRCSRQPLRPHDKRPSIPGTTTAE